MDEKKRKMKPFDAINISEFRLYVIMRFFFIMALRMIGTVVGWKIYILTRNPLALGMIGLSEVIPAVSLALYAGHIIDKSDKRKMLLRTICFYGICAIALLVIHLDIAEQYTSKKIIEVSIYLVIFCTGVIRSFSGPISNSIIAQLVPKDYPSQRHYVEFRHLAYRLSNWTCQRRISDRSCRLHHHFFYHHQLYHYSYCVREFYQSKTNCQS